METAEAYTTARRWMLDLVEGASADQLQSAVPYTPPWTVLDVARHLAGVAADVLAGNMPAGGPQDADAWTAAQIASRADADLATVVSEWDDVMPALEATLAGAGPTMMFLVFDVWTHGHDVRAVLGVDGGREGPLVDHLAAAAIAVMGRMYAAKGAPAVRLVFGDDAVDLGAVADVVPTVELHTSRYEFLRVLFGRRSVDQVRALDWRGDDPEAVIAALHIFDHQPAPRHD